MARIAALNASRVPDLEAKVGAFIGSTPAECGRYFRTSAAGPLASVADVEASLACGLAFARRKVPFWFFFAGHGMDSWVAQGIVGNQKGELYYFNYDDNSFGPRNPSSFDVKRCFNPKVKDHGKGYAGFECWDPKPVSSAIAKLRGQA